MTAGILAVLVCSALFTFLQYLLGRACLLALEKGTASATKTSAAPILTCGVCLHLATSYAFLCIGLPWWPAILLPLAPGAILLATRTLSVSRPSPVVDFHWLAWTIVTTATGATLLVYVHGYKTYWEPAAGDYAFHLSIIHSFVFGHNFPANYPVFAGVPLSYPFMIDLWSSILWSVQPTPVNLWVVFLVQWTLLLQLVFFHLRRPSRQLFPWLIFLGGGSYALFAHMDQYSWQLIRSVPDMPWSTMLASIWIPQRSALFGAVLAFSVTGLVIDGERSRAGMIAAGALLGIAPLVQTDFALVTALFCGLMLLSGAIAARYRAGNREPSLTAIEQDLLLLVATSVTFALPSLLLFAGKAGLVEFIAGWNMPKATSTSTLQSILRSADMWLVNAWQWFVAVIAVGLYYRRLRMLGVLATLFLLGNVVQFAVWEWDQVKIFVALYVVFVAAWASVPQTNRRLDLLLAVLLCLPGVVEYAKFALHKPVRYFIFSEARVEAAERLRQLLPDDAIITGAPVYDNPVLLTGRPVFTSFIGWLYTHHLDYWYRDQANKNLEALRQCKHGAFPVPPERCPDYLFWDESAAQYWHIPEPPAGFRPVGQVGDAMLYSIPRWGVLP